MSFKLKPTSRIIAELGLDAGGEVQKEFTNECYRRMDKYVPMGDGEHKGDLRSIVDIQPTSITYEVPYAHAQYVGYTTGEVKNYTTPGTGPYWDRRLESAEMDEIAKKIQKKFFGG